MPQDRPKILIATGGTGGHLYPAIALAGELEKRNCEVLFVIRINDNNSRRLKMEKFRVAEIPAAPFFGQSPLKTLLGIFVNLLGLLRAFKILNEFKADRVAGFGAYVSVPMVLAAFMKGIPVVLHEQNVVPGWANRLCSIFAKKVAVSFPETLDCFKKSSVLVGNPVRREISGGDRTGAIRSLGLKDGRITVLVFGGSGGAKSVNEGVLAALDKLSDVKGSIQFLHLSGSAGETEKLRAGYQTKGFEAAVLDYSNGMKDCYTAADLAVCRSGASTVSELIVTKIPAILIPYPYAVKNHQRRNADVLEKLGCAVIIEESGNWRDSLAQKMKEMIQSEGMRKKMADGYGRFPISIADAPAKLADAVLNP